MSSLRSRLQSATGLAKSEAIAITVISSVLLIGSLGPRLWPGTQRLPSGRDIPQLVDSLSGHHVDQDNDQNDRNDQHAASLRTSSRRRDSDGEERFVIDDSPTARRSTRNPLPNHVVPRGTRVNLNSASEARLVLVPGIGPATARAIIVRRSQRPFRSVDELLDIRGIGPRKLERMRPYVSAP